MGDRGPVDAEDLPLPISMSIQLRYLEYEAGCTKDEVAYRLSTLENMDEERCFEIRQRVKKLESSIHSLQDMIREFRVEWELNSMHPSQADPAKSHEEAIPPCLPENLKVRVKYLEKEAKEAERDTKYIINTLNGEEPNDQHEDVEEEEDEANGVIPTLEKEDGRNNSDAPSPQEIESDIPMSAGPGKEEAKRKRRGSERGKEEEEEEEEEVKRKQRPRVELQYELSSDDDSDSPPQSKSPPRPTEQRDSTANQPRAQIFSQEQLENIIQQKAQQMAQQYFQQYLQQSMVQQQKLQEQYITYLQLQNSMAMQMLQQEQRLRAVAKSYSAPDVRSRMHSAHRRSRHAQPVHLRERSAPPAASFGAPPTSATPPSAQLLPQRPRKPHSGNAHVAASRLCGAQQQQTEQERMQYQHMQQQQQMQQQVMQQQQTQEQQMQRKLCQEKQQHQREQSLQKQREQQQIKKKQQNGQKQVPHKRQQQALQQHKLQEQYEQKHQQMQQQQEQLQQNFVQVQREAQMRDLNRCVADAWEKVHQLVKRSHFHPRVETEEERNDSKRKINDLYQVAKIAEENNVKEAMKNRHINFGDDVHVLQFNKETSV